MIKLKDLTPELVEMVLNPDCTIKNWERLRHVLLLRLGKRHTQDEIAQLFGVSKERIRQIENRAIDVINKKFNCKLPKLLKESDDHCFYHLDNVYMVYEKLTRLLENFNDKRAAEDYYKLVSA